MRYLLLAASVLFFAGCTNKVFTPHNVQKDTLKEQVYNQNLEDYSKNTLTFSTLRLKEVKKETYLDDGLKIVKIYFDAHGYKLGKFTKINTDLAVNGNKILVISTKEVYELPYVVFSATKRSNEIAVVFNNGKYGVYDTTAKKMKFIYDSDEVLSVKYLHAQPLFYQDLILYPLLSGNVAVVDAASGKFIRILNISQNQFNDNVIFLKIVNNHLFMATPSKLVLFNPSFLIDYQADIKHVIDYDGYIYIFTSDGSIIKLDTNLKEIKKVKLPYASFFAPSVCNGNIWTVEKEGYLLKITPDLNVTVYTGNDFNTKSNAMLKIDGCKIYNEDKVFMIE